MTRLAEIEARKQRILEGDLPRHVAIIMDGNGRWARRRRLPRILGHREGRKAVRRSIEVAAELGVEVLTLFTFSMENWSRPSSEVKALMQFLEEVLLNEIDELNDNDIRLTSMGRLDKLPDATRENLRQACLRLEGNKGLLLNLALSYSGRCEIVDAARKFAERVASGEFKPEELDEEIFSRGLYLPDLAPVDLLIRTSGEQRISNFCLWQLAYSEIHITPTLWPDFATEDFYRAIEDYQGRERRFGRV